MQASDGTKLVAKDLGIRFPANISEDKLLSKIESMKPKEISGREKELLDIMNCKKTKMNDFYDARDELIELKKK